MCPQNEKCSDPVCCEWICLSIYQAEEEGYKVVTTIRAISLLSRIRGCQLLCHRCCERLQPIGRSHHHLEVNDLSFSVKLDDIHTFHAQRANMGAEFEDDRIVTNKLPIIRKVLQNANRAAQV